jgi:hypothetical protein
MSSARPGGPGHPDWQRRGGEVRAITWQLPADPDICRLRDQVAAQATAVQEMTEAVGAAPLVIGKSLGSLAAGVAADLDWRRCGSRRC